MSSSIISKLRPNYLDKSKLYDNILVIKKLNCINNTKKLNFNLHFLEKTITNIFKKEQKNKLLAKLISKLEWQDNLTVLILSFSSIDEIEYINSCDKTTLDIVGVDLSLSKLKKIDKKYRDKLDISLIGCCAQELPFLDEQFDIIVNIGSFNHYSNRAKATKEMLRVTKNGGKILLADKLIQSKIPKDEIINVTINYTQDVLGEENYYYYILSK